ncbi:ROK family protein [Limibacter armeniacum]|uniref:ROK family protein n=1 Tax=Limibacter armeniacum TaxID=466084 RepID=UPI002FE53239
MEKESTGKVSIKKRIRKSQILSILRDRETLSPSEVAGYTEFTLPMSSSLMKELMAEDMLLLVEDRASTKIGRPPTSYALNPDGGYFLGVKVGLRKTRLILLNLREEEVYFHASDTAGLNDSVSFLDQLCDKINYALAESGIDRKKLLGLGLAVPGLVNRQTGHSITYFSDLELSLKKYMEMKLGVKVEVTNDVNAVTLGEKHFGAAKDLQNVACINLDWGIGMGLIIGGELYEGKSGLAGELGHIKVEENGDICTCGKIGCLETIASGKAMLKQLKQAVENGQATNIVKMVENGDIENARLNSLIQSVQTGDHLTLQLMEDAGAKIGKSIGILINLLNLECIILGGKLSQAGDSILYPVRSAAIRNSLIELYNDSKIICSDIRRKAGCLGASTLISRSVFNAVEDVAAYYV